MNWYAYANGNPVMYVDPSGYVFGTPLTYGEFFSAAGSGAAQGAIAYGKGVAVGAASAVVIAGAAAGAVTIGVPAAVVTGGLFAVGAIGGVATGYSIVNDPSAENIAYNIGGLTGGILVGGAVARPLGQKLSPSTHRQSVEAPTLSQEFAMRWQGSDGKASLGALFGQYGTAMGTGPTFGGSAGVIATSASGAASVFNMISPISATNSRK